MNQHIRTRYLSELLGPGPMRQPDDPGPRSVSLFDQLTDTRARLAGMTRQRDAWRVLAFVGWGFVVVAIVTRLIWPA